MADGALRRDPTDLGISRGTPWLAALDPETTGTPDEGTTSAASSPSRPAVGTGATSGSARAGSAAISVGSLTQADLLNGVTMAAAPLRRCLAPSDDGRASSGLLGVVALTV